MLTIFMLASIAFADPPALPAAVPLTPPPTVEHCKVYVEVSQPGYVYRACGNPATPRGVLTDSSAGAVARGGYYNGYTGGFYTTPGLQTTDAAASSWGGQPTWSQPPATTGNTSGTSPATQAEIDALNARLNGVAKSQARLSNDYYNK